jgi:hypothetical protein
MGFNFCMAVRITFSGFQIGTYSAKNAPFQFIPVDFSRDRRINGLSKLYVHLLLANNITALTKPCHFDQECHRRHLSFNSLLTTVASYHFVSV